MSPARTRQLRRVRTALATVLVAGTLAACGAPQSALDPQGPFAESPDDLFRLTFWIAVVIFVIVQGLIIYSVWKFRERPGDDDTLPKQVHGNTKLEITWTVIPAVILAGIAVPTVQTIFDLDAEKPDSFTIEVIGHRWWWEYIYPEQPGVESSFVTANEMVIPVGRPVRLEMTAADPGGDVSLAVLHSYWVPKLGGKQEVHPGRTTTLNIQADEPGRYLGQCGEYCGLSHANMRNRAVALEDGEFEEWLRLQQEPAAVPDDELAREGAELFGALGGGRRSCVACHAIRGYENIGGQVAGAGVGPDLTHLMSRREFAGAVYDLYRRGPDGGFTDEPHIENLTAWLANPNELKPMQPAFGVGMPNLNLTDEEIEALVAFLVTLK